MSIVTEFRSNLNKSVYYLGFLREEDLAMPKRKRYSHVKWLDLQGYKDGWFADPFFLSYDNNRIELLAEEKVYSLGRGIISHLDIVIEKGKFILKSHTPILILPTHLSFPNIWRENNKVYVYPENWHSGGLNMYEYDNQNKKLINPICLIKEPLVDSQMFKYEGVYYIAGTRQEQSSNVSLKKAEVYMSNDLFGPYKHYCTLTNERKIERGAGQIYMENNQLIRPVQKCDNDYGEAVILNELFFEGGLLNEKMITIIEPDEKKRNGKCLHTFNKMNGLCVIDGRDYYYPNIKRLKNKLEYYFRKNK